MITREQVEKEISRIRIIAADFEAAHGAEDDLREEVLEAIANGHPEPQELAKLVLQTGNINFPRYRA